MLYVTLAEAKNHLNVTAATSDGEVGQFGETAEQIVLGMTGPIVPAGAAVEVSTPYAGTVILAGPVESVASVTDEWGLPVVGWRADLAAGLLYGVARWGPVSVSYVAAGSPLDVVRTAVLMVLERLWETQRGSAPSLPEGEGSLFTPGMGGIIAEVRSMLTAAGMAQAVTA